jgi:hypothetical protein
MFQTRWFIVTITSFTVILNVMWNPTRKNTIDALKSTCRYVIVAIYLVQRPIHGLVNQSEPFSLYLRKKLYVLSD